MTFHGYELIRDWKVSNCGETAIGQKGGRKFFIKKYKTEVAPLKNGALDAKTAAKNQKRFDEFVQRRKKINATIREITGPGGNIIIPCDEFIDENYYCEAAELVEGGVPREEMPSVLASLSLDVKKLLLKTAAGALFSVHKKGIVHSDLKLDNVMLVRNKRSGSYVSKLIDFDSSYFLTDKPEEMTGDIIFFSPELANYSISEDDRDALREKITEKTDIFSLGLIFHYYLTNELPKPASLTDRLRKRQEKGKAIYCWSVLNAGCELQLSPAIENPVYAVLIADMLSLDPKDRPSADEVLRRMDTVLSIEEPWPEHHIVLVKEKMNAANVVGMRKVTEGGENRYEVLYSDGRKEKLSKDDLVRKGFAKLSGSTGFPDPWPEHKIEWNAKKLNDRGFVGGERKVSGGAKGYDLMRGDGKTNFFTLDSLLLIGYAKKKPEGDPGTGGVTVKGKIDDPWPEDRIVFDPDVIHRKQYVRVERMTRGGIRGYQFTRADGKGQFLGWEMAVLQRMARKI